jgi:hypothetical protein
VIAFLWVEDFEGRQYREFAHALFGAALGIDALGFPDEEYELREFLEARQIFLATSYAEAARLIQQRLDDVDSVVLDLDINLLGEDTEEDLPIVLPLLQRWYGYEPDAPDQEASYDRARAQMKLVAGYHLYLDLVMNRGFPQNRILFCSNHGPHMDSINNSFEAARIEVPPIYKKGDEQVKQWVATQMDTPYLRLRRWVTLACREILERMRFGQTRFLMPDLPGRGANRLNQTNAELLLETLPRLLPPHDISRVEKQLALRLLARTLAQDWDKVDFREKTFRLPAKGYAAVLVNARNWTSHEAQSLSRLDEGDAAFLFLIAMRTCFEFRPNRLEEFEKGLLPLVGEPVTLDPAALKVHFEQSFEEIEAQYVALEGVEGRGFFATMVNTLHLRGRIPLAEEAMRLYQILWHQFHWKTADEFSPRLELFGRPIFLNEIMRRIYRRSFPERR